MKRLVVKFLQHSKDHSETYYFSVLGLLRQCPFYHIKPARLWVLMIPLWVPSMWSLHPLWGLSLLRVIRSSTFTLFPECALQHYVAGTAKELPFLGYTAWISLASKAKSWLLILAGREWQAPDYPPIWNNSNTSKKHKIYGALTFKTLEIRHWKIVIPERWKTKWG